MTPVCDMPVRVVQDILRTYSTPEAGKRLGIKRSAVQSWRRKLKIPSPVLRAPFGEEMLQHMRSVSYPVHNSIFVRRFGVTRSTVFEALKRLEKRGLVRREGKRSGRWVATERGIE